MANGKQGAVGRQLRTLFNLGTIGELTDGQLMERFATGRGEAAELAFAALVERHGPMVLRVCRAVLDDADDSEDAFQATFLVLVAKGRGLWVRDSLGPWLHQVAYRTASCLRSSVARRRKLERRAAIAEDASRPVAVDDSARVLLEEVDRLPERYRAPVVLCDLEGRTHEQAARALGWPIGTVKSRQARARDRLRERLARRGFAPGFGLLAASTKVNAPMPIALIDHATVDAVRFVASRAIAPGTAASLAREVLRSMTILRWWKSASVLIALVGAAASGVGLLAQDQGQARDRPGEVAKFAEQPQSAPVDDPSVIEVKPGKLNFTVSERGFVEASRSQDVISEAVGSTTLTRIKPEGIRVKKGEVVAELDPAGLNDLLLSRRSSEEQAEASFKQAKLVREVAQEALKEYSEGLLPQEQVTLKGKVAVAEVAIEKVQARLERTRLARKRLDEARNRRVGPEIPADVVAELTVDDRLDDAELTLQARKLDLEAAKGQQVLLEKYTGQKRRGILQGDVEKAKLDEMARRSAWVHEETQVNRVEREIAACTLLAPVDGILVYANNPGRNGGQGRIQIEEGATIQARQKVFSVFDLTEPMRINAKVHESIVDQVPIGAPVGIRVHAAYDEVLTGVVRSVAPMADVNTSADNKIKLYTTLVQIDQATPALNLNLRPGMSADVKILIFELDGVLAVPVGSVVHLDDKDRVAVRTPEGNIELREVTLGKSTDQAVEVKQGLRPGDRVVLDPVARMNEPMRARIRRRPPQSPAGPSAPPR